LTNILSHLSQTDSGWIKYDCCRIPKPVSRCSKITSEYRDLPRWWKIVDV